MKISGGLKWAHKNSGPFFGGATYLHWHSIYASYKKIINLQRVIRVIFGSSGMGKNCTLEFSVFLLESIRMETKTRWEQVKVNAAHLSTMKASQPEEVNTIEGYHQTVSKIFCLTVSQ